ncbi:hypothetical protein IEN91_05515 [Bacillus velezensis]|uniref:hypothetical protein n=1 Tax=Bacillus velezensis TaxID=492670 RepID=UPI0018C64717|nr:hypothetical protein [Bacillus velezensis]QPK89897.1 hypothetical protein IEN91_05515 [Bacillus velezensis]
MVRRVCVFYSQNKSLIAELNRARIEDIFFQAMKENHGKVVDTVIQKKTTKTIFEDGSELFIAPFGTDVFGLRFTEIYIDNEVKKIENYKDIIDESYSVTVKRDNILMFSNKFHSLDIWRYSNEDDDHRL